MLSAHTELTSAMKSIQRAIEAAQSGPPKPGSAPDASFDYELGCELIAKWLFTTGKELMQLLSDLGSLEVTRTEIEQDNKYGNRAIFAKGEGVVYVQDILTARRLVSELEFLLPSIKEKPNEG